LYTYYLEGFNLFATQLKQKKNSKINKKQMNIKTYKKSQLKMYL